MPLFDYRGVSTARVLDAAQLAAAAYVGGVLPTGWSPLTAAQIGFSGGPFAGSLSNDGRFTAGVFSSSWGAAALQVSRNGNQLSISFRGTDSPLDATDYDAIYTYEYLNSFRSILTSINDYAATSGISSILVTGHSLGAAAANLLRDSAFGNYAQFSTADFITFATPRTSLTGDVLNVGFENDLVFKAFPPGDFSSTTDNIVFYNNSYSQSSISGVGTDAHAATNYVEAVQRITASSFYNQMTRDSVVVVVATNDIVQDRPVLSNNHRNADTFYIGRDIVTDQVNAGSGNDRLEGFGGDDILRGGGGNDIIYGGAGTGDIAAFSGPCIDYDISYNATTGAWTVAHLRGAQTDGTDTLTGIEFVQFGDKVSRLEVGRSVCVSGGQDLAFVIDTTGSMDDDIAQVKAAANRLISDIFSDPVAGAKSRIGIVGFKDPGETQTILSFTNHTTLEARRAAALNAINSISVSGGGDTPEGVYSGLRHALAGAIGSWREDANIRRIVLFGDAPPKDTYLRAEVEALARDVLGGSGAIADISAVTDGALTTVTVLGALADGTVVNRSVEIYSVVVGSDTNAGSAFQTIADSNGGLNLRADTANQVVQTLSEAITTPYLVSFNGTTGNDSLLGTLADDRMLGLAGADVLSGGGGHDSLIGGDGADTLLGGAGNDRLEGGTGADAMDGGDGDDLYFVDNAGDTVIETGGGYDTVRSTVSFTLSANIERLELSGTATSGIGNALSNTIIGGTRSEQLIGHDGDDILHGGAGNDTLNGGAGIDTADYSNAAGGISVQLYNAVASSDGDRGSDTLAGIDNIRGSAFADTILGDNAANHLTGGAGDDRLQGRGGVDILDGGDGDDTVDYSNAASAITVDLRTGRASSDGDGASDTLISVEHLIGTAANDTLIGSAANNTLSGGLGRDVLMGLDGADILRGGGGVANELYGGRGDDLYVIEAVGDSVVELAGEGIDRIETALASMRLATNVENLTYTGTAAFTGTGNASDNVIMGGTQRDVLLGLAGNDTLMGGTGAANELYGGAGNDTYVLDVSDSIIEGAGEGTDLVQLRGLRAYNLGANVENATAVATGDYAINGNVLDNVLTGGAGADILQGGAGNDTLHGGAGVDTVTYILSTAGVTARLDTNRSTNDGLGGQDTFASIENLTGSNLRDTLMGDAGNNVINGAIGDDVLLGFDGNDTLIGGSGGGNNEMYGGRGNDLYIVDALDTLIELEGEGVDTVQTTMGNFTLRANIENMIYVGPGDFAGTGNAQNNVITGSGGNDTLAGRGGNDTLNGGAGADMALLQGVRADYTISSISGGWRVVDNVAGRDGTDLLYGVESVRFADGTVLVLGQQAAEPTFEVMPLSPTDKELIEDPFVLPPLSDDKADDGALVLPPLTGKGEMVNEPLVLPGIDTAPLPRSIFGATDDMLIVDAPHCPHLPYSDPMSIGTPHDPWFQ